MSDTIRLELYRQALAEIASTSPVARTLANKKTERCTMCRCLIDRAREALGQDPWPAPSRSVSGKGGE